MNTIVDQVIASFVELSSTSKYLLIIGYGYLVIDPFSRFGAAVGEALLMLG